MTALTLSALIIRSGHGSSQIPSVFPGHSHLWQCKCVPVSLFPAIFGIVVVFFSRECCRPSSPVDSVVSVDPHEPLEVECVPRLTWALPQGAGTPERAVMFPEKVSSLLDYVSRFRGIGCELVYLDLCSHC